MNILEVNQVSKNFGAKKVLRQLDLSVPAGSIYGFVGENGAGKTTTMKLILGLEDTDAGEIFVKGEKVSFGNTPTNRITGYLPDVPAFYGYMRGEEYLKFCGEITGIELRKLKGRIGEMLELVGLAGEKKKIKGYSRGMKQRLGIAQALLNEPELLICDEPTSALDPSGRNEFLKLLASLRGKVTVIFSTHILNDVERICDYAGILDKGKLAVSGTLEQLKKEYAKPQLEIAFENEASAQRVAPAFAGLADQGVITSFTEVSGNGKFLISYEADYAKVASCIFRLLLEAQAMPHAVRKIDPTLEHIFLEVTK